MRLRYKSKNFSHQTIIGKCVIFNSESTYWYLRNESYKAYVDSCNNVFIDGIGVAIKIFGFRGFYKRYHGPDLLNDIADYSKLEDKKLILIGGMPLEQKSIKKLNLNKQITLPYTENIEELLNYT